MAKYDRGDYNFGGKIAFFFAMIFTIAFFIWVSFFYGGVDLKELPQKGPNAAEAADQGKAAIVPDEADSEAAKAPNDAVAPTESTTVPSADPATGPAAEPNSQPTSQPSPESSPAPNENVDKSSAVDENRVRWNSSLEVIVQA